MDMLFVSLLFLLFNVVNTQNSSYKLFFVNALWRHGDRTPLEGLGTVDHVKDNEWTIGGGGWGTLTTTGMRQHFNLGRKIRKRYINTGFLSQRYKAKEIYVRADDYNRTIVSAYSNLAGMYSNEDANIVGVDVPSVEGWPNGWIPIPVHVNSDNTKDHELNDASICPRLTQLRNIVYSTKEWNQFINDPQTIQVIRKIGEATNRSATLQTLSHVIDTLEAEAAHINILSSKNESIVDWYPWFFGSNGIREWAYGVAFHWQLFLEGLANPGGLGDIDIEKEISRIRGGALIRDILQQAKGILNCTTEKEDNCDQFHRNLKYYALSAHDQTVSSYLISLQAKLDTIGIAMPVYTATVITEFYVEEQSRKEYFKVFYHDDETSDFRSITSFVRGCPIDEAYCPLEVMEKLASVIDPGNIDELCQTNVNYSASTISPN